MDKQRTLLVNYHSDKISVSLQATCLPTCLHACLPTYLPTYLHIHIVVLEGMAEPQLKSCVGSR